MGRQPAKERWIDNPPDILPDGQSVRLMDRRMDGQAAHQTDRQMDGQAVRQQTKGWREGQRGAVLGSSLATWVPHPLPCSFNLRKEPPGAGRAQVDLAGGRRRLGRQSRARVATPESEKRKPASQREGCTTPRAGPGRARAGSRRLPPSRRGPEPAPGGSPAMLAVQVGGRPQGMTRPPRSRPRPRTPRTPAAWGARQGSPR